MIFECRPSAQLSPYVECFILQRISSCVSYLPQGVFDLLINESQLSYPDCVQMLPPSVWLIGQHTRMVTLESQQPSWVFTIRLKPFALLPFSQFNAKEIKNAVVCVQSQLQSTFYFNQIAELFTQASSLTEKELLFACVEVAKRWLNSVIRKVNFTLPELFRAQSNAILLSRGNVAIHQICNDFSLSKVTLGKHFMAHCGLLPKELSRIWRLNYFLFLAQQGKGKVLTDAALQAGFYDQAHLNREFKAVFDMAPKAFFSSAHYHRGMIEHISNRFEGRYDPYPR
ncbi:helix-turn-helix domain-containing protein [Pseudoalteromonas sp. S16_S37]|uniref:helix-turn-helix domain-containing protein n=1 Tax=Pseudoalteromonas sp. S16_S37 TaxID=2720228 RepID=UPI0016801AFB|nr:helix-turn-helix domain-containing protein [Pseudoalteromonas sp. S16_S37]MBD1584435.1 AraC family transcriptional regulator [Pseudoalteromonas sp. S16_S37]